MDKLYGAMYNDGNSSTKSDVGNYVKKQPTQPDTTKRFGFAPEINSWAKKNQDAIMYAGDGAINSIKKASNDYLNEYLKDAPEETDKDELFGSIAKWQLARDANDEKRGNVARNNIIGHMSTENKDHYLKEQIPFSEYVKAKDDFDYKTGKYTTTEYASKTIDEAVKRLQQKLNENGYTDNYGNKLNEDGTVGSKTLQAYDSFEKYFNKPKQMDNINSAQIDSKKNLNNDANTLYLNSQDQPKVEKLLLPKFMLKTQYPDFDTIEDKYGKDIADTALDHAINSYYKAKTYMENNNIKGDAENVVDAYRHFAWNVALTRDVGIDKAKYIANLHEYLDIKNYNWLKNGDIDKGNLISGQMNQSMLMDLWNNSVARTLASDKSYREKNVDELFEIAMNQNVIIEDVNKVYDFLGIKHCADQYTYTVNVTWDTTTGNITVYDINGKEFMTLKIGV